MLRTDVFVLFCWDRVVNGPCFLFQADVESLKKKADVSLLNTKVDHKQMQLSIQRSMTPLEDAFTNFMELMKKQMASAVSQTTFGKVCFRLYFEC